MKPVVALISLFIIGVAADEDCKSEFSKKLDTCRKKYVAPMHHLQQVKLKKAQEYAVENCTDEYASNMSAKEYLMNAINDDEFVKNMWNCLSEKQTERLNFYGIGTEYANLKYHKCVTDVVEHEKRFGHKKE